MQTRFVCSFFLVKGWIRLVDALVFSSIVWCVSADRNAVLLLPFEQSGRGEEVDIFSPYYPCSVPSGPYEIRCEILPVG